MHEMHTPESIVIKCDGPTEIIVTVNSVMPLLSRDMRRRFNHLKLMILSQHGVAGLHSRFNGRSVAEILEESKDLLESKPIASGELDGMRFEIFEKPGSPDDESQGPEC